jgi:hypothetical protein
MKAGTWNYPGTDYFMAALADYGLTDDQIEDLALDSRGNVPQGMYPVYDRVMERAWQLRGANELSGAAPA